MRWRDSYKTGSTQGTPHDFNTREPSPCVHNQSNLNTHQRISLCDVIAKFHRLRFHTAQPYITEHRALSLCSSIVRRYDILTGRQGCGCPVDTSAFLCRSTDRAGRRDRRPLRLPYCNGIVGDNLTCTVLDLPQYIIKQTATRVSVFHFSI